ncbi:ABC transporter permease [Mesorhizobium sp. M0244]|uniref:ABC transporter permease n=1 Tax=Mesorhizobium sp. M0244 TaxID=2956926 RepID=UPI00333823BD
MGLSKGKAVTNEARAFAAWNPARGYAVMLALPVLFLSILFILPLLTVIYLAVSQPPGFDSFVAVLSQRASLKVLRYTFQVAGTVTIACLLIGYPVAFVLSRTKGAVRNLAIALVLIPFWTSVVVRTFAWIVLFQRFGIINNTLVSTGLVKEPVTFLYNSFGVHIGMVHVLLPFAILPLLSTMQNMDKTLLKAAEVLGANPLRTFVHVFLPLSMPGVMAAVLLVFISALGFYVTPALLGGPPNMMISVLIEQYVNRTLNWPAAAALASILLVLTVILYLVFERVSRRFGGLGALN